MNKMEDLINMTKLNELLNKKEEVEEKKTSKVVWIFAIIGIVAAVAAAVYGIYRFFTPDYLEDFEDDFEDDFDDDFLRTMMMRKRRQSLRTKRKQPKIKTKGMGLQRDAALFLCNRKRSVGMRISW